MPLINTESVSSFKPTVGSRSTRVDLRKGQSLLKISFNKYAYKSYKFYRSTRSMEHYSDNFLLVVPGKIERASKDTSNFYYVMFDNLPSWKGYPSRSKSIIFTNKQSVASDYTGTLCQVYPINNAKIAFGVYGDGFLNLPYAFKRLDVVSIPDFMQQLNGFFKAVNSVSIRKGAKQDLPSTVSLENSEYKSFLNSLDNLVTTEVIEDVGLNDYYSNFCKDIQTHKKGNWEGYFDDLFNPQKNGIHVLTEDNFNSSLVYEFWTDSPCLLKRVITF